jgi:hypothetical protein
LSFIELPPKIYLREKTGRQSCHPVLRTFKPAAYLSRAQTPEKYANKQELIWVPQTIH